MYSTDKDYTIYIISNERANVVAVQERLQNGYNVLLKPESDSLMESLRLNLPDLIILDLDNLVDLGQNLLFLLKKHRVTSHIPLFGILKNASQQDYIDMVNLGVEAYLSYPINFSLLEATVGQILKQRKILREKYLIKEGAPSVNPNVKSSGVSRNFMQSVLLYIYENLSNQELNVEDMASHFSLSRTQFYRKIKAQTGVAPNVFIRKVRLEKAKIMLETNDLNINEVVYEVGFASSSYFAKCFKKEFGYLPLKLKNQKNNPSF